MDIKRNENVQVRESSQPARIECTTETKASNANLNYNNNGFYKFRFFAASFTMSWHRSISCTHAVHSYISIPLFHSSFNYSDAVRCAFSFAIRNFNSKNPSDCRGNVRRTLNSGWLYKRWFSSRRINNLAHTLVSLIRMHSRTYTYYSFAII